MSLHNFQLISFPSNQGSKNALLHGPRAYVCVESCSKLKYPTKRGVIAFDAITPECVNFLELERHVDSLVKELHKIKRQGKTFFEREGARTMGLNGLNP